MSEGYRIRKKVAAARERGRRMANARWNRDRERRDKLAVLTAEQYPIKIARRIIVIDDERLVRETVIWSFLSGREWLRKERQALAPQTL